MGIRDYLKDPAGRRSINRAIRSAFERRRGAGEVAGRILVVDDDPLTRETLVRTLQRASYHVVGASDGRQALGLIDERPFDLVITDTPAPERDRTEMVAALRLRAPGLRVLDVRPGSGRAGALHAPSPTGESHSLNEPFDTQQLLQAIRNLLEDH